MTNSQKIEHIDELSKARAFLLSLRSEFNEENEDLEFNISFVDELMEYIVSCEDDSSIDSKIAEFYKMFSKFRASF